MKTLTYSRTMRGLAADPVRAIGGTSIGAASGSTADATQVRDSRDSACPCRTETTTKQVQVSVPVTQTRVVCDTPAPTTNPVDCLTVQAAVQQATAGMNGMSGLADDGGASLTTLLLIGAIGVIVGKYVL